MDSASTLFSIIAHARSGALDHANRLFTGAGLDRVTDDPAVLSVRARLLKDRAALAAKGERRRICLEAARLYERAAQIGGEKYPLINAATLFFLAGRRAEARRLAQLALQPAKTDEQETPYWRAATLAEAELLLANYESAKLRLRDAVALAPHAYEDHASTLRQFGLILDAAGERKDWLDAFRPPRSLHYAGHMSVSHLSRRTAAEIRDVIARERIGFGFGALAAGADILIAEAVLEAGAELHAFLPSDVGAFRHASVERCGKAYTRRFDDVVSRAATVRVVGKSGDALSPLRIRLAAIVAMGGAIMQAESLVTEAVQLLILDDTGGKAGLSGAIGTTWRRSGRRQEVLAAGRVNRTVDRVHRKAEKSPVRLAAVLRIDFGDETKPVQHLQALKKILAGRTKMVAPPRWTGEAVIAGFEEASIAAGAALRAIAGSDKPDWLRIAGHYGPSYRARDPFSGQAFLSGPAVSLPGQIVHSTPPGAIHVSEDFAAALAVSPSRTGARTEYVGELPGAGDEEPVRLFSVKPSGQQTSS